MKMHKLSEKRWRMKIKRQVMLLTRPKRNWLESCNKMKKRPLN